MKNLFIPFVFINLCIAIACNNDHSQKARRSSTSQKSDLDEDSLRFGRVEKLSDYKGSDFMPALESPLNDGRNGIYAASLLYAWHEIRKTLKDPITVPKQYPEFSIMNSSMSFMKTLAKDEYQTDIRIEGFEILANASFRKLLPFDEKLQKFDSLLTFSGKKVASFGMRGYDYLIAHTFRILCYNNDNDFIIALLPKDKNHEIILYKRPGKAAGNMSSLLAEMQKKISKGEKESRIEKNHWRYTIGDDDDIIIPVFKFHLRHNFPDILGDTFMCKGLPYLISGISQRTAFMLDESGAAVSSEAEMEVTSAAEEWEKPKPKLLVFDKPFLTLLKRIDSPNPYFAMWTENSELMMPATNKQ